MYSRYLLVVVSAFFLAGSARAQFTYEFANASGNVVTNFSTTGGSPVTLYVYLVQTGSQTNLTANGLAEAGVSLNFSSSAPFTVTASSITPNGSFYAGSNTSVSSSGGTTTATLQENASYYAPVYTSTLTTSSGTQQGVLLGSFTFTGSSAGGTGVVTTSLPDPTITNNVDGAGNVLDTMIANSSAAISVSSTAVPEPGTFLLTGLAGSAVAFGAWRRRRSVAAKVA